MITIILITAIFLLINGIPFMRICLGRWPWQRTLALVAVGCAIVSTGLSPSAHAVTPAPGGGYPGDNNAEGDDALFSLTTVNGDGVRNTAIGFQALYSNTIGSNNTAVGQWLR